MAGHTALAVLANHLDSATEHEITEIVKEFIENRRLLRTCAGHSFTVELDLECPHYSRRWQCQNCKGWRLQRERGAAEKSIGELVWEVCWMHERKLEAELTNERRQRAHLAACLKKVIEEGLKEPSAEEQTKKQETK